MRHLVNRNEKIIYFQASSPDGATIIKSCKQYDFRFDLFFSFSFHHFFLLVLVLPVIFWF